MIYNVTVRTPEKTLTIGVEGNSEFEILGLARHCFKTVFGDNFEMSWEEQ